jgi:hypothetical protein
MVDVRSSVNTKGRVAQSVERWSNKPLVKGSSPFVTRFFCHSCVPLSGGELHVAFVAERLRRYVQVVVTFGGVGSSPTECNTFFLLVSRTRTVRLVRFWHCSL